jgi:xylulokinase
MKKEVLLGIDAGTSSVKVVAFTLTGTPVGRVSKKNTLLPSKNCCVELDPEEYSCLMFLAIKQLIEENNIDIIGIGFSSACPCITFMDEEYNAIGNSITYLDNRAGKELNQYLRHFSGDESKYFSRVGNRASISTSFSCSMKWVKNNEPDRWYKTKHIGMLNSFLAAKLTGCSAVDTTQASYSGIFDLSHPYDWDAELVDIAGIDRDKLLPILHSYEKVGCVKQELAEKLGIRAGTAVAIGSGDTAAASFGLGFIDTNIAFESAGTSGVLTFALDKPQFDPVFMNRCHVFPDMWLAHGATSMTGGAVDWLRKNVFDEYTDATYIDTISPHLKRGAGGVVFLPYLAGERSPIWNSRAKAVWFGMDINTTKYDMIEAVVEAGAFALKQIKDHAVQVFGITLNSIVAVGNGTKSAYNSQLKADIFSTNYRTTGFSDYAAWGAALMGGCAAEIFDDPRSIDVKVGAGDSNLYSPHTIEDALVNNYKIYNDLYPSLAEIMNRATDR